jgi:two-component sensor histidine kinase
MTEIRKEPSRARSDDQASSVKRLLRQQAALASFGSFAFREPDIAKVLAEAARVCAEGLGTAFCKVCRYRPDENDLLVEAGVGWKAGVIGHVVSRADDTSPQGRAFMSGQPTINLDLRKDNDFALPAFYAEHGIISTVDVIIKGNGVPYGVLEIDSDQQHDYSQHDIEFLTGFANVVAEAVATSKRTAVLVATIEKMKLLAAEKDMLAEELQHRVRNNLQLVYGMLIKQLDYTEGGGSVEGFRSVARRVMILAQVYDHLLGTGMTRRVDFAKYLTSLCASVSDFESSQSSRVAVTCDADPTALDLDIVTALGIVVTELISNSYRHAFPDGTGGIAVQLRRRGDGTALLSVADTGQGFERTEDDERHGLRLVTRLMDHIKGSAKAHVENGTSWSLVFPYSGIDAAPQPIVA